jgi:hypothetical protein
VTGRARRVAQRPPEPVPTSEVNMLDAEEPESHPPQSRQICKSPDVLFIPHRLN